MNKIKLGDVLDFKRGMSVAGEFYANAGKYVRLTLGNFTYPESGFKLNTSKDDIYYVGAIRKEFIMKKGDIITPLTEQVRGLLGNTATIPEDDLYIHTQDVAKLIPNEDKIDKRFAYYLVSSPVVKKQLDAGSQQTKIRHTSPDKLKDCYAYIPEDKEIQNKIAKILDTINNKISNNTKLNLELESMAKTLYDYWFLQFEFPNEEGKPYKSSGGKMVYNDALKMDIPEGWKVDKIGNRCEVCLGGTPARENDSYWNGNINWLNSGEIANFPIVSSEEHITQEGLDNSTTELMKEGTTVISITGNIRCSVLGVDSCANQSVVGVKEADKIKKEYIYQVLKNMINRFTVISGGNCQKHINKAEIQNTLFLIPNDEVLTSYNSLTNKFYNTMILNAKENQELSSLRDFLLPLLMNGQVTFKEK